MMGVSREEVSSVMDVLEQPPYWLVIGMDWPGPTVGMAEAAYALAPSIVPRDAVPRVVADVLGVADVYIRRHPGRRSVWFTDLTRWMDEQGTSWAALNVDWEEALRTLPECPTPGLHLTVSQRAHGIICDATRRGVTFHHPDGTGEQVTPTERDLVHHVLEERLAADWPPYIRSLQANGQLAVQ
jgi:hypothetical protein